MTKYIDRYYLNGELYGIKFAGGGGWQPGANTLVYMPIDTSDTSSTVYDHSTNQTNFSWYGTASYDTLATGKRVINLTGSNGIYVDSALVTAQPCTVNLRIYRNGSQNNDLAIFTNQYYNYKGCVIGWLTGNTNNCYSMFGNGSNTWVGINNRFTVDNQTWTNIVMTLDNGVITTYKNGIQIAQASGSPNLSSVLATSFGFSRNIGDTQNFRYMNGKMGDIIVEDKVRTVDEISDYFDQTKSLYGIS